MNVLMIGDVIGKPGRRALTALLPELRTELKLDIVIANGENAAGGFGLTERTAQEIFAAGVDVITSGNHIWDQKEIIPLLEREAPIVRPANYPEGAPGRGLIVQKGVAVLNLQGRAFMIDIDDPFRAADAALAGLADDAIVIVDMHCEATSEKQAMGRYLDGRVAAVLGTHTHVPTADARVFPGGTAFVTDVGMTGPVESIIGTEIEAVLQRFLTAMPGRLPVAEKSPTIQLNSVIIEIDEETKRAKSIRRVDRECTRDGQ
ncbi:MAG: TIGR00282 family metallophosphoesterase [Chloroflexi bacterium]|nr:TIGR00282 family metallophosphoesterase [Chloroflexota bacterium]